MVEKKVIVTPELSAALADASRLYENIADGEYLVFCKSQLRYFNLDLAAMRAKAELLHTLSKELRDG